MGASRVVLTIELPVVVCPSSDLSCIGVVVSCSECTLNKTFINYEIFKANSVLMRCLYLIDMEK